MEEVKRKVTPKFRYLLNPYLVFHDDLFTSLLKIGTRSIYGDVNAHLPLPRYSELPEPLVRGFKTDSGDDEQGRGFLKF